MVHRKQKLSVKLAIITFGVLTTVMLFPSANDVHVNAISNSRNQDKSSISVALDARIDLEITPSMAGTANYTTTNLTISTTNSNGFRVFVNSDSTTLRRPAHLSAPSISSITKPTTLSSLPNNTWGIYFGITSPTNSSVFRPVPTTQTELIHNELENASGTYKFAIAAKADTSLPAGYYASQLTFSVVAESAAITSLADATYMQDITPEICKNSKIWATTADSVSLIDKRDGKTYKVARLKDGNCWMQENLTLALSTSKTLTPSDTDILKNWTPTSNVTPTTSNTNYAAGLALAGTQSTATTNGAEYAGSICPKGWKLPLGGTANQNVSGSYYHMIVGVYGVSLDVRDAANPPMYFIGNYDYVTRTAYNNINVWTERIYSNSNYASWASEEPFTDPVSVRCIVTVPGN